MDTLLEDAVARWRTAGLLDEQTVAAIRTHEERSQAVPAEIDGVDAGDRVLPSGRAGLVAEGLAYLGAALAFGAGVALFAELWTDLSGIARTSVAGFGTVALAGAAAALSGAASAAVGRLRSVLAALAVVGVATTVGVGLDELTTIDGDLLALLVGLSGLAAGIPAHRWRPSWPTTLALGAALMTAVVAAELVVGLAADDEPLVFGVTAMGIGLAWAALGWAGVARPRHAFEITGLLTGGVGVQTLAFDQFPVAALVVGLVVAGGVLAVGIAEERTSPAVLGGLGITVFAPQLVVEVFGDTIGGPLALFVGGLALVAVAITVLRQRADA